MSYLLDLLKVLKEPELAKFRQLDLIGKEELVRDAYLRNFSHTKFDEAQLAANLKLSQSHFDKINSVLLDKTLHRLYGHDNELLLGSVLAKGLSSLVWHELKILQRRVLAQKNQQQVTGFYKAAFDTLIRMFHPNYSSKLTHGYGKKYLQSLGAAKSLEHEVYVALFAHYGDMIAQYMAGNELTYKPNAWGLLKKWQQKITGSDNPNILAYYYYVSGTCCKYYGESAPDFLDANYKALQALELANSATRQLLYGRVLCETGFGHIENNEYAKGVASYDKAFNLSDDMFQKSLYHAGNFFFACLCNGQPQKAEEVYTRYLQHYLRDSTNTSVRFDLLQSKFSLHLHLQQYERAFEVLNQMRAFKKSEITTYGHVMVRFSETLYYYLSKDYKVAAAMAQKNLKFLARPENQSPQFIYCRQYIDCIDKLIKKHQGKLRFPEKLDHQIAGLQRGIYFYYNCLLQGR